MCYFFFFSSRRRHTRLQGDWSSDVCSSDLGLRHLAARAPPAAVRLPRGPSSAHALPPPRRRRVRRRGLTLTRTAPAAPRSEERRVGKERRYRTWQESQSKRRTDKTIEVSYD